MSDPTLPPYLQITADIEQKIRNGTLQPGERLRAIADLAHDYQVNKNTVVKALDRLKERKLIVSRQGFGTFIASVIPAEE